MIPTDHLLNFSTHGHMLSSIRVSVIHDCILCNKISESTDRKDRNTLKTTIIMTSIYEPNVNVVQLLCNIGHWRKCHFMTLYPVYRQEHNLIYYTHVLNEQ